MDQYTGYRFYQADQAMEFVRIKSFQEAMFSIEEIKEFISKSDEEILEHFEQKIVEQENKLQRIKEIKMSYRRESEKMNKTIKENQRKVLELSVGDVDVYFALNLVSDFMINDGTVKMIN